MEARAPGQRGLPPGLLDHRVHQRRHDAGALLLDGRTAALGQLGKLFARTLELVFEDCLGVALGAVTTTHLAATAGLGAGSDSRTRLGAGAGKVKPQNISAIPTSSPR
jgi:hypothetical protein